MIIFALNNQSRFECTACMHEIITNGKMKEAKKTCTISKFAKHLNK